MAILRDPIHLGSGEPVLLLHPFLCSQQVWTNVAPKIADTGRYEALERDGGLVIYTAREAGVLVGYAAFFLVHHAHYRRNLFALNDVFYVDPARRSDPWLGFRFLKFIDAQLTADADIDAIKWHTKVHLDFGPLLRRLGYQAEEVIWSKVPSKAKE